jgi:hypothetical protein
MTDILSTLRNYDKIHGILILFGPGQVCLTVMFCHCISELLAYLHCEAVRNIVFGITKVRFSNCMLGEMFGLPNQFLDHPDVGLELSLHMAYCFDSESFHFLAAYKNRITINNIEEFRRNWKHSRAEA